MLKLFKRWGGAPARRVPDPVEERPRPRPAAAAARPMAPVTADPLPEVVAEGNDHTDWSLWEESVFAMDSQMQDVMPSSRVHVRDTRPSRLDDLADPFAGVRTKRRS